MNKEEIFSIVLRVIVLIFVVSWLLAVRSEIIDMEERIEDIEKHYYGEDSTSIDRID